MLRPLLRLRCWAYEDRGSQEGMAAAAAAVAVVEAAQAYSTN